MYYETVDVSQSSIYFDGVYAKIAFFGSKCLHLRKKRIHAGQAAARKSVRISCSRSLSSSASTNHSLSMLCCPGIAGALRCESIFDGIFNKGNNLKAVAVAVLLAGDALETVHMAIAYFIFAAGASGKLVEMTFIGIRAEGHLVRVMAVSQVYGLAGYGGKAMVVGIASAFSNFHAALNLMQMNSRGTIAVISQTGHPFFDMAHNCVCSTSYAVQQKNVRHAIYKPKYALSQFNPFCPVFLPAAAAGMNCRHWDKLFAENRKSGPHTR